MGKVDNDYGRGFYCTESLELAKEWACPLDKDGYANKYSLDLEDLSVLYLNSNEYHILNWLALLLKNRQISLGQNKLIGLQGRDYLIENFAPDITGYDVIVGYRANEAFNRMHQDELTDINGLFMRDIIREGVKNDDPRLR